MAIRYRKVRVVNPTFDPVTRNPPRGAGRMASLFSESQLRAAHKQSARDFHPDHPTALSIIYLAEESGIEITDPDSFRDAVEKDMRRLGLRYQGDPHELRIQALGRRMARGENR